MPLLTQDGECTEYWAEYADVKCEKRKVDVYRMTVKAKARMEFSNGTGYIKWDGGSDKKEKFGELHLLEVRGTSTNLWR